MPRVSPFTGLLFDPERVGSLERVTAPPYDSVSPDQERKLHGASPHNVVRLILGRDQPGDDATRNKYTRAASYLRQWEADGGLVSSDGPAWYPYEMEFSYQAVRRRVRGLLCEVELEPPGGSILPHERTLAGPLKDRLDLLRQVNTNLSPVYALFSGPCVPLASLLDEITAQPAPREMTDDQGVDHRTWIARPEAVDPAWLRDERLLIADGHHRYAVALAYREEMHREAGPGPWDRMMMLLVDASVEDPPVLPIHRLLVDDHGSESHAAEAAASRGDLVRDLAEVLAALQDDDLTYGTAVRDLTGIVHRVAKLHGHPPTVCALHDQVLGDALPLRYLPNAALAEAAVRGNEAKAAFFLPPTHVGRIRSVVEQGGQLPQKSTYFWPKPRTGMVMRPLR